MRQRVRIAGAGPAGLCAAVLLARAGVRVEVREKRERVAHRFSEAVHGIENWSSPESFSERLEAWGIDLGVVLSPCHELWLCDSRRRWPIRSGAPLFYLVQRGPDACSLEGRLLRLARQRRDVRATLNLATSERRVHRWLYPLASRRLQQRLEPPAAPGSSG